MENVQVKITYLQTSVLTLKPKFNTITQMLFVLITSKSLNNVDND